jgi:hypothetical protein
VTAAAALQACPDYRNATTVQNSSSNAHLTLPGRASPSPCLPCDSRGCAPLSTLRGVLAALPLGVLRTDRLVVDVRGPPRCCCCSSSAPASLQGSIMLVKACDLGVCWGMQTHRFSRVTDVFMAGFVQATAIPSAQLEQRGAADCIVRKHAQSLTYTAAFSHSLTGTTRAAGRPPAH